MNFLRLRCVSTSRCLGRDNAKHYSYKSVSFSKQTYLKLWLQQLFHTNRVLLSRNCTVTDFKMKNTLELPSRFPTKNLQKATPHTMHLYKVRWSGCAT